MNAVSNYTHLTIWNMNGGPLPQGAREAICEAVEATVKDIEERDGLRLLWAENEVSEGKTA